MIKQKILVTGGAGYIGSTLVPVLLRAGHKVTVIDNFMYGQNSLLDCCFDPKLTLLNGDARDEKIMAKLMDCADTIIPLASIVGAPACDKDILAAKSTNLDAIKLIVKLKNKRQRIIFPNTNSGYGIGQESTCCNENTPLNPVSFYGRLKVEAEQTILRSGNAIVLRLATVFGISPRMRLDLLVNDFVYRAVHDHFLVLFEAHFKRNFIHVRDVARAFIHCIDNFTQMRNQVYNVGLNNANLSKLELCKEIKKQVPNFYFVEAKIGRDPDQRNYIVSNDKILRTGFSPSVSIQEGIAELIKGYQIIRNNSFANI